MDWWLVLVIVFSALLVLMVAGMPVAFAFMMICLVGAYIVWGGVAGLNNLVLSMFQSLAKFSWLPMPLFILMGSVMFETGVAPRMLEALEKWMGRLTGRLSLLAVFGGALVGTFTGSSLASTALLGSVLVPEMTKRGYQKPMSLGPVLGSGGLAIMIPPSGLAITLGVIGEISIGKILIAIIVPGLMMAVCYATYIIVRCRLQPHLAPVYEVQSYPLAKKLADTTRYILPIGFIIFLVTGVVFLGIATPTEAAALGALGSFILAAAQGWLNWKVIKKSLSGSVEVAVMIFLIVAGANAYSQILAFTGASRGMVAFVTTLSIPPIMIIIALHIIGLILGMFMTPTSIMMITIPLFIPIVSGLGLEPLWFGATYLLNMEMAVTSPPFGTGLFVMKGVAPPGTTMGDCYRGALPFLACDSLVLTLIIAFPSLTLWLPGVMKG